MDVPFQTGQGEKGVVGLGSAVVRAKIVSILGGRFVGSELFKPYMIVVVNSTLIIVDKTEASYMYGIYSKTNPSLMPLSFKHSSTCDVVLVDAR